jgi:hypothetical protein
VLTTCHDNLLAEAFIAENKSPTRYWYHYRGEPRDNRELNTALSRDAPAVYHLFGSFDEPNSLVLTENDLLDFINHFISSRPSLPNSLRSLLRNNTFLFVGFGVKYWYIRLLLKILIRTLDLPPASIALEHLGDLGIKEREQTILFYSRGVRVELVDMEIDAFLRELSRRLDESPGYVGTEKQQIRLAQVFISYERSDEDFAKRLFEALPKNRFDIWIDHLLREGEDWSAELEEKIKSSDYFLSSLFPSW